MIKALFYGLMLPTLALADNPMRGWYYYDDPKPESVQIESKLPAKYKSYSEFNEAVKREFEEIQNRDGMILTSATGR